MTCVCDYDKMKLVMMLRRMMNLKNKINRLFVFSACTMLLLLMYALTSCADLCEHRIVTEAAVTATCTENGFTEGQYCSLCDVVFKERTLIIMRSMGVQL